MSLHSACLAVAFQSIVHEVLVMVLALEAGAFGSETIPCFAGLMRNHGKLPNVAAIASTACLSLCCGGCLTGHGSPLPTSLHVRACQDSFQ